MKIFILSFFLMCNLMAITANDAAWILDAQTDLNKAYKLAKQEKRSMIVLLVVKDGCDWCEKMVHGTFQDPKVKNALSDAVVVVSDIRSDLGKQFKATMTPTVFFIDPKTKKSIYKQIGYERSGSFLISIISAADKIDQE